uniref:NADH-ubiquinone oxidoreductase chain 4L n=1 Tax=Pseudolycoriella sp. XQM-2020 TaxID=2715250 RepID=A0A6G7GC34_9DIPT|nr:NADH dehydrogenase subunit 4L [Pseudolycoriella sp. XQM-2020]
MNMSMMLIYFFPLFMVLTGGLVFISNRKHLLITLLSLEYLVLGMFLMMVYYLNMNFMEMYFLMVYLVFGVCEGALGLSILVSMIRTHGNNYFQSFNSLLC